MTSRYEPKTQAFGLEPKACSGYGWEFFLASFGAFLLSLEPLRRNSNRNFREIFPGKFRASENFEFLISFWDFSIRDRKKFPTEDHEGVRFGSGGNPNKDERRRSRGSFLIHQINRSSFVARKQRIFDGIQTHRDMDGGKKSSS